MLLPVSIEFTTLCQTQVTLLIQSFQVNMGAVYLSKDLPARQQGELVPIIIYPEDLAHDLQPATLQLPASASVPIIRPSSISAASQAEVPSELEHKEYGPTLVSPNSTLALSQTQRLVIPLIHDEMVLGLLVVARDHLAWSEGEQSQLQQIADTLAIACILDQRSQWLANSQYQQRALKSEQHQTLSNLLHQFRNPLTALKTLGKLLQKRFSEADNNRKIAASIVEQSDRLEEMLHQFDDAIDLGEAAIEPGDVDAWVSTPPHSPPALPPSLPLGEDELHLQPCQLMDILSPLIQSAAGRVDQKKLQLAVSIPKDLPPIQADGMALREVCSNLLDNALKYTPAGGEVCMAVHRQVPDSGLSGQLLLISDSGPGIPQTDLNRVFEREYRGVQAQTDIPGTGLGLAIAKTLVEQMQGEIQAFSPRIDQPDQLTGAAPGSTFLVRLLESDVKILT
ncbi:ATP-binding protein [Acaryochloris sp. IP29b_bin.137]|uniref:GAF domain-containing sensor histidine kinase n=1 Tax=Acaryochloris sp. IP29b_bin.137 TaxID=2969217 RepID=UPI0026102FFF|nr:ATP-binding protein [Acaryochloris sp. IP29b_bin.137]